ncbi:MAG: nuclear transport factor 2 family protein [Terriglobia bacterium]
MKTEEEKVFVANQRFYTALETLDLEAMDAVWLHEDWVMCVHPGWELLEGWEQVRESWQRIFENTRRMQVNISNVIVRVENGTAWVNCVEQVTSSFETGFSTAWVQATNIYVKRGDRWPMVHHHASPISREEEETIQ